MRRHYLRRNKNHLKAKSGIINGSRVILLDSALKLELNHTWTYENPKYDFPELPIKRQDNRTVFELNDHESLNKSTTKPKVNFINFIEPLKIKAENNNKNDNGENQEFEDITVKQESNKFANNSLPLVEDKIIKISDYKIIKPYLMLGTIKKVCFVPIKPKITLDQTNLKKEQQLHNIQLKKQTVQVQSQPTRSTKSSLAHSKSSIDCGNISKVLNEQQLLNKIIPLNRLIKLCPLNINKFKSSQENKKHQLSSILKKVIKNNLTFEFLPSKEKKDTFNKEAFPVAIKSIDNDNIKLLDFNPTDKNCEQILGI